MRIVYGKLFAVAAVDGEQNKDRDGDGEHLGPVLNGLYQGDALHAAQGDVHGNDGADQYHARPVGQAGEDVRQRGSSALHLRHGVEEPDEQHEHDGNFAEYRRVEAAFGEIRDRVGAEPSQGPRDEQKQKQVSARVTDRVPKRVVTDTHHHAGHAHERCGAEVFAGDGGGVPADGDGPAGNEEVLGGL